MTDQELLDAYQREQQTRIDAERQAGFPKIAAALAAARDSVVAAWPDITVMGKPWDQGGREIAETMCGTLPDPPPHRQELGR